MDTPSFPPSPASVPQPILRAVSMLAGLVVVGDFLMWNLSPGVGYALFLGALAVLMMIVGERTRRAWFAAALLFVTAVQAGIDLCLTNIVVTLVLLAVLLGETRFGSLPAGWPRWLEGLLAWMRAPGRWFWLVGEGCRTREWRWFSPWRTLAIAMPALFLTGLFAVVLANGNAVLADGIGRSFKHAVDWLFQFDFSPLRVVFWALLGTMALVLARPSVAPSAPRLLARPPAVWLRKEVSIGFWQSVWALGALNALFFIVNTIDAIFLWRHGAIPSTVNAYDFIHEGTNSLITAVVLSAIVLSAVFQQQPEISRRLSLRVLGHLWIVQNLALLASVVLRLKLYVDFAHLLTAKRIHLGCFLALVALGFVFLVLHLERGPDLRRLLWRNSASAFVLLFTLQFVNTTGLSAAWNVQRFLDDREWGIDLTYLETQGFEAWPALCQLAAAPVNRPSVLQARSLVAKHSVEALQWRAKLDWREREWRRDAFAEQLIATSAAHP
jgi:hypothetical protein